jgi:hypothetical protein
MKRILFLFFIGLFVLNTQAQVKFTARVSKKTLTTDDRMVVRFDVSIRGISADINNFTPPKFEGFKAMGPSTSEEYYNNNGKTTIIYGYTYYLQPQKTGTLTIGKAKFEAGDKTYETQAIQIEVVKGKKKVASSSNNNDKVTTSGKNSDIFLVAEPTKTKPYVNEAVGISYRLYFSDKLNISNYEIAKETKMNGFWVQTVDKNVSGPYQGTINGKDYTYYVLYKKLLFPQHAGKLTINPLSLNVLIRKPVIRNYGFMRVQEYQMEKIRVTASKKVLNVKELPQKQKPDDFSGAVGNFSFKVNIDNSQVKVGDPVNISVIARGKGNFKLFDLPKLKTPEGLELFDPKHKEQLQTTYSGNSGLVKESYVIVPNTSGKFIIPGLRFVYFDPQTNNYEIRTTNDIVLFVTGDGNTQTTRQTISKTTNNNSSANDFRFIKNKAEFVPKKTEDFFGSKTFEILLSIPFILAFLLFAYHKYQSNKVYDADFEKLKKSKSLAQKFLKDAKNSIGDKKAFYANLEKAFHNFLKANLKIDTSEISRENIKRILQDKSISEDKIEALFAILNKCDMARYAPATTTKMEEDYIEAEKAMNQLFEKNKL